MSIYDTLRAVRTLGTASVPSLRCALCDAPLDPNETSDICADCYHETTDSIGEAEN